MNVVLLPGIIAPAALRYRPLLEHLPGVRAFPKELEIYAGAAPPENYSITTEIDGLDRSASQRELGRFHLYGHSGGGAVALAYAAAHPQRVLSLAVDEPASDFSDADFEDAEWTKIDEAMERPEPDRTLRFLTLQLAPGVGPPPAPTGPAPPWMAKRLGGMSAFVAALRRHRVDAASYAAFDRPVYYSFGTLSNPRWTAMRDRLAAAFPDFLSERYEGLHHLRPAHQVEPALVADTLLEH